MKINIAKSSGFCFGVRRAIDISMELGEKKKNVFVLGDIVHNSFVVMELESKGVKKIGHIKPSKNSILIISAHGAPEKTFIKAKNYGYSIIDATCPKVKDIYKIAKRLEKTRKIIIIGDSGHGEIKGIAGQLKKKPVTIESPKDVSHKKLSGIKKAAVVTQSTQTLDNINKIMDRLIKIIPDVELHNTTCQITRIKQKEITSLPKDNAVILIIGSRTSANTKRLYQIARNINKKTYWIECADDLKKTWFKRAASVGIMAGASTPDYVTQGVVKRLKLLKETKK